ncbi:DegT/DnrJ/EryC1/StrS family aminotransferase [Paenibacillus oenotherae]|uniref:DegT/DnrJ/EryC1/StrS family aminotransferase n=1 Tax=Paenibacillus oenotherae TaxID=1435645 RepID=A0ABS7D9N0_9BACL|nr:DegT/DnrJ/EryC1/StrS family aminotransferase [Paenibacillus oenotherae]MBW7476499.1 DegT/DnrJ/EryC1/StrS family aminotransferase [Paenibacillus oenotherae]
MTDLSREIPAWPLVGPEEQELVAEVTASGNWWRFSGGKVLELEKKFAEKHGTAYALTNSSGTNAIEVALMALQIKPGDEVIVPAFTFISTATPVMLLGGIPVPVDVDPVTFCVDPERIREAITARTAGIIPVHMAGHVCDMDAIREIAKEHSLFIIEDACHAHGAEWNGQRAGSIGDAGVFSFQALKLMTAGEGGMITTNSEKLYNDAFLFHHVGRPLGDRSYQHLVLGSNYRLSEFQGAALIPQVDRLDGQNALRERNAALLDAELSEIEGIITQGRDPRCNIHTHYMYMFYYDAAAFGGVTRDEFVERLNGVGIPAYKAYAVIQGTKVYKEFIESHSEVYAQFDLSCPISHKIAGEVIWIHHKALLASAETVRGIAGFISQQQQHVHI